MGSCVICGKSVDGKVCNSHEEDVLFEFYGDDPTNLVSGRYYKGTVDGFADFGVFVDLAPSTTGLLHESEIEGRLENLDWEPGDTVFVQVIGVHDSGKVDLGWSIRQSERGFRHKLIQDDTGDHEPEGYESTATEETENEGTQERESSEERTTSGEQQAAQTLHQETKPERVSIANLEDHVGDEVQIEGKVIDVFQTSGPTIFQIEDETGTVDCAAFKEAGERAYPGIETDDIVGVTGDVELHNGDIQLEADQLELLEAEARSNVTERLESALMEQARPPSVELLGEHSTVVDKRETIVETATTIRQAIFEDRPVIIRHTPTVDGYVAGAAIEHAILPLVTEKHTSGEAEYHYVERKPLDDPVYDMNAATADITSMLTAAHRHDEKYPLIVLVDAGSTRESLTGLEFLEIYDVDSVVIADGLSDSEVESVTTNFLAANTDTTAGLLGANVAANVNPDIRNDLAHLPAISFWHDVPDQYVELAASAGYDEADIRELREAVALEAYYQQYESKRELIQDLFWEDENQALASYISTQYRTKLENELDTVTPHIQTVTSDNVNIGILDADSFTHQFDFPPTHLLLDAIHDQRQNEQATDVITLGVTEDRIHIRSTVSLDVRDLADDITEQHPEAGILARGSREGRLEFLQGERETVLDAVIEAIQDRI